jgi:very-short-patch-repair endonuclease
MKLLDIIFESVVDLNEYNKMTVDEFIKRSNKVHGGKYNYDKVVMGKNTSDHVTITCPIHGDFSQNASQHLLGRGCKKCGYDRKSITKAEFLKRSIETHGNKYNYDKTDVTGKKVSDKVLITCPKHGDFLQGMKQHMEGNGCKKCFIENRKMSKDEFIQRAKEKYGDKYSYDRVKMGGNYHKDKVLVTCPIHGDFPITPSSFLNKRSCPKCTLRKKGNQPMERDEFIQRAKEKHGDRYGYDNVEMGRSVHKNKVTITCSKHGDFLQSPWNHLNGAGCPYCSESRGESRVKNILKSLNLPFMKQHTFDDCVSTIQGQRKCKKLQFDFYIPSKNLAIEYDGIQHFKPVKKFGGDEQHNKQLMFDKIKDEYCKKMGIKLIRIPYTEFNNIEEILKKTVE